MYIPGEPGADVSISIVRKFVCSHPDELRMSDDHSDMGATENEADHADMTDDGEVEFNLPRETVEEQIRNSEDIRLLLMRLPWPMLGYRPTLLGFTIGVTPLAVAGPVIMAVAGVADAGILFLADLAGPVPVGVDGLAVAGILFPADLAGTLLGQC